MMNRRRPDDECDTNFRTYSKSRGVAVYLISCSFLWFLVAPLIAPTGVPPPGAPDVPLHLIAIQMIICYEPVS